MENVFNLKRFGNLLSKHLREHLRTYIMSLVVFTAIILGIFVFMLNIRGFTSPTNQFLVFMFSLLIGMFIFTAGIYSDYNHPRSAFTSIMLPASRFEKYFLYWLISLVGFTIVAIAAYYLSQTIIIAYLKTQGVEAIRYIAWHENGISPPISWLALIYTFLHSITFLGAIAFRKRTIILTALVSFLSFGGYIYLSYKASQLIYGGGGAPSLPFTRQLINTDEGYAQINQSPNSDLWLIAIVCTLIILFWTTAFFKLKEREI